jgi:nucleotide-binding universal stress UspA family protein
MAIKRVLVPVDFSANSLQALEYAVQLAKPLKAGIQVLFVVEPIYFGAPDFSGATAALGAVLDEQRRSAQTQLERLQQRYAKRRVELRILLQTGVAHHAIVEAATQLKADLIVMATHGRTGVAHLLIGSVAERVVRTATCPVLTIHADQRSRRAPRRRQPSPASKQRT